MVANRFLAATALASAALFIPHTALAQAAPTAAQCAADETLAGCPEDAGQAIVVTGSRIARPNLESTVPVTSIGGGEFFQTGNVAIGDTLNELPSLRSTFSQSNSTRFLGTAGLNLLDLRGLGTQRTLVLVDGRRHVGADILSNGVSPDTNTFPTDLIERVDIVTGGNSAVYGSDAIAGVVNFVTRRNFDGLKVRDRAGSAAMATLARISFRRPRARTSQTAVATSRSRVNMLTRTSILPADARSSSKTPLSWSTPILRGLRTAAMGFLIAPSFATSARQRSTTPASSVSGAMQT